MPGELRNIKLIVSYDGTDFAGWQRQPGKRTVQATLEEAIADLTGEPCRVNASGRTDAGVHSIGQVCNFRTQVDYPAETIRRAVNARLPADLVIRSAEDVPIDFDANRHAKRKLYRYVFELSEIPNPLMRRWCYTVPPDIDLAAMRSALRYLCGTHDFRAFESEGARRASSVRTITYVALNRAAEWAWLDIEASGFLYNMVRAIVGTLVRIGVGYWPSEQMKRIIESKDRSQAGPTAPPQGLFLVRVTYDDHVAPGGNLASC